MLVLNILLSVLIVQVRTPVYFITLHSQERDGSNKDIQFSCSFEELQDLLAKLKDAQKQVERVLSAKE